MPCYKSKYVMFIQIYITKYIQKFALIFFVGAAIYFIVLTEKNDADTIKKE